MIAAPAQPKTTLSPAAQWEEYLACKVSPAYFIDSYIQIRHPKRGTIPFRLWDWQAQLLEVFEVEQKVIILKARQIGVTELSSAFALWLIRFHATKDVIAISESEPKAQILLEHAKFGHEHLPAWLRAGDAAIDGARLGKCNGSVLEIEHREDGLAYPSQITSLAATENNAHGYSASLVILDEWARQFYAEKIWEGAEGATNVGGQVFGISTANGLGNTFHRIWEEALKGENDFKHLFLGWNKRPERDQAWYERQKKNLPPWQLHQNYPSNASEAFIQTGRPVYEPEVIDAHAARLEQEQPLGYEDEPGLTIYEWPCYDLATREETDYLIAADVAEGLEGGDYDAAVVLNRATGAEVAELRGQWSPEVYAAKLDKLGHLYFQAKIAVERNNHGHAVLLSLQSGLAHQQWTGEQERYRNLYYHEDPAERDGNEARKPGWPTTSVTKPLMLDVLGRGLRDLGYHTRSRIFLSEAKIFAHLDGGKMGAPAGYHDDTVICRAIAWYIFTHVMMRRRVNLWIPGLGRTGEDD